MAATTIACVTIRMNISLYSAPPALRPHVYTHEPGQFLRYNISGQWQRGKVPEICRILINTQLTTVFRRLFPQFNKYFLGL